VTFNKKRHSEQPLVGIETNPGPNTKKVRVENKHGKDKNVTTTITTTACQEKSKPRERRRNEKPKNRPVLNGNFGAGVRTVTAIDNYFASMMMKKFKLSPLGIEFLKMVLDPMHDVRLGKVGWPGTTGEPSVVHKIPKSITLSRPESAVDFPPGSPWGIFILVNDWLNPIGFNTFTRVNNVLTHPAHPFVDEVIVGGVQAWALPGISPAPFPTYQPYTYDFSYSRTGGVCPPLGAMYVEDPYSTGSGRLLSLGIELVNTTATIFQQGLITSWRAPDPNTIPSFMSLDIPDADIAGTKSFGFTGRQIRYPPNSEAQALLYNGATQFPASAGSYMVASFYADNPPGLVNYTQPWFDSSSIVAGPTPEDKVNDLVSLPNVYEIWAPNFIPHDGIYVQPALKTYPINQQGIYVTGLSEQSSFELKMNCYYETFPSISQTELLDLSTDHTPRDPQLLSILSEAYSILPIAVPSYDNWDGEWWATVVDWLGSAFGVGLSIFGLPEVAAGVKAVSEGGSALLRMHKDPTAPVETYPSSSGRQTNRSLYG